MRLVFRFWGEKRFRSATFVVWKEQRLKYQKKRQNYIMSFGRGNIKRLYFHHRKCKRKRKNRKEK